MNAFTSKYLLKRLQARKEAKGFTLIELMVVVAIVGVLTAVGLPELTKAQNKSKDSAAEATLVNAAKECSINLLVETPADALANFATQQATGEKFEIVSGNCAADGTLTSTSASGNSTYAIEFDGSVPGLPVESAAS